MRASSPAPTTSRPLVRPTLLWFAMLAGVTAWGVHLFLGWGVLELACLGGPPSTTANTLVLLVTVIPLAVAVLALAVAVFLRIRASRLDVDALATERTKLLLVIALVMDALVVAAIAGDGVALLLLEPCG